MQVEITQTSLNGVEIFLATCGKKTATVRIYKDAISYPIHICCHNAAHKTWGIYNGFGGKPYETFDAAINAYKSKEMKAIIQAVQSEKDGFSFLQESKETA